MGKYFQALEVHQGMERIQDLSSEEKARFGYVLYFVNLGRKPSFCIHKKKRVVIKLILFDEYILASFLGFLLPL